MEMIRNWNGLGQFLVIISLAGFGTLIVLAILGIVGDFLNHSLPLMLRGHPPKENEETAE